MSLAIYTGAMPSELEFATPARPEQALSDDATSELTVPGHVQETDTCPVCLEGVTKSGYGSRDLDFTSSANLARSLALRDVAQDNDLAMTECGHAYHNACLLKHVMSCKDTLQSPCAVCRRPLVYAHAANTAKDSNTPQPMYEVHSAMRAETDTASHATSGDGPGRGFGERFGERDNATCLAMSAIGSALTLVGLMVCLSG